MPYNVSPEKADAAKEAAKAVDDTKTKIDVVNLAGDIGGKAAKE